MKDHFIIQAKGGCGKSTIASFIAQFLLDHQKEIVCIDTDPLNASFAAYERFSARSFRIMDDDQNIDPRSWDILTEILAENEKDTVIDNGATSFASLMSYLVSNETLNLLSSTYDRQPIIHIPIAGSEALPHTVSGLDQIISQLPGFPKIVVWLNPFWGPLEHKGLSFVEFETYQRHKDRITGIVNIPTFPPATFGADLQAVLTQNLTFAEALAVKESKKGVEAKFNLAARQRIKIIRDRIYQNMIMVDDVFLENEDTPGEQ